MFNSPFSMVVAIVFLGCLFSLIKHWIDSRQGATEKHAQAASNVEMQQIIDRLEHRIQVLERIVTDSGYDLKSEIDRL